MFSGDTSLVFFSGSKGYPACFQEYVPQPFLLPFQEELRGSQYFPEATLSATGLGLRSVIYKCIEPKLCRKKTERGDLCMQNEEGAKSGTTEVNKLSVRSLWSLIQLLNLYTRLRSTLLLPSFLSRNKFLKKSF